MATRYPAEFRQRAVELARLREKPITQLAADLGVSDQALRNWLRQADIDEGRTAGQAISWPRTATHSETNMVRR